MKKSLYNTALSLSETHWLLYNALTDSFIILRNSNQSSIDQLYNDNKEDLVKGGFIIEDSVDELKILQDRLRSILNDNKIYSLIINPTLECNFSCWYCYEEKRKGTLMSEQTKEDLLFFIRRRFKEFSFLSLSFVGGEPFLAFNHAVLPIIRKVQEYALLYDKDYRVSFTTNGSLLTDKKITLLKEFRIGTFQITLDGDKSFHNKTRFFNNGDGSYDLIVQNICKLLLAEINVTLRVNYTAENVSSINSVVLDLIDKTTSEMRKYLTIRLHQVWQTRSIDLSNEIDCIIRQISDHNIRVEQPTFNYVIAPCYADRRHSAVVNYNGDVYKCTAVDFLNVARDGYLTAEGSIKWENNSNEERLIKRLNSTVSCKTCRIQPLCNGGCSQNTLQCNYSDNCLFDMSEEQKDRIVLDRFAMHLRTQHLTKNL